MLKFGFISEVDISKGLARVKFSDADIVSSWLPIIVSVAKADKISIPLSINEQVSCLMDDNCEYGVILGALYSEKVLPPNDSGPEKIVIEIAANKTLIVVDRTSGNLDIKSSGTITVEGDEVNVKAQQVNVDASIKATINTMTADITASTTAKIAAPVVTLDCPAVSVTGALSAATISAGGFSGAGGAPMAVTGNINVIGQIDSTGDIKAGGKSVMSHTHTAPSGGGVTSTPI